MQEWLSFSVIEDAQQPRFMLTMNRAVTELFHVTKPDAYQ